MISHVEITKLNFHDNITSHLIQIGKCNIICDLPLNPDTILNFRQYVAQSLKEIKVKNLDETDMSEKLVVDRNKIPVSINFILISNVEGFVGLPIFCKYFDLSKTQILCTKPTYYFALCVIQNLQKRESYLPLWEDDEDVGENTQSEDEYIYYNFDASLRKNMHLLSYKEKIKFVFKDVTLEFSCYSSGYALGSCNFYIKSDFINIVVISKSCINSKRYPSPFDITCFKNADIALFTAYTPHWAKWANDVEEDIIAAEEEEEEEENEKEKEKEKEKNEVESDREEEEKKEDEDEVESDREEEVEEEEDELESDREEEEEDELESDREEGEEEVESDREEDKERYKTEERENDRDNEGKKYDIEEREEDSYSEEKRYDTEEREKYRDNEEETGKNDLIEYKKYKNKEETETYYEEPNIKRRKIRKEKDDTTNKTIKSSDRYSKLKKMRRKLRQKIQTLIGTDYKDAIKKLCSIVICAIKKKGCVLIPMDLYYLYFIELTEMIGVAISKYLNAEDQVTIFTIMSNINDAIYYAESCADWVDDYRKEKCCRTKSPEHPFSFNMMKRNNRLFVGENAQDIASLFKCPCVCFIQDSSLRLFESSDVFKKWMNDEKNTIILVDTTYDPLTVLQPFNVLNAKINIFFCPIMWQLNEFDVLKIIYRSSCTACEYIIPQELQWFVENANLEDLTLYFKDADDEEDKTNKKNFNKNTADNQMWKQERTITTATVLAKKLKTTSIDTLMKKNFYKTISKSNIPQGYDVSERYNIPYEEKDIEEEEEIENNTKDSQTREIDLNRINYIYPCKRVKIEYDDFAKLKEKLIPARFFCDSKTELEKKLNKMEDIYFADVECQLTSSFVGDFVCAEDIYLSAKTEIKKNNTLNQRETTMKETVTEERISDKADESKKKRTTEKKIERENERELQKKDTTEKANSEIAVVDFLLQGTLKATDVRKYFFNRGYKTEDVEIFYEDVKNLIPWRIKIKPLNGEIRCDSANNVEVFTSNEMFRQNVTDMMFELMNKY